MDWLSLNIDEIIYRIHVFLCDWIWEPVWYVISFRWVFDSVAALSWGEGSGVGSTLYRIFSSRPSVRRDSVEEALNPTSDRSWFEYVLDIFTGRSDHESIFAILFGTVWGWFLIIMFFAMLSYWYFNNKLSIMSAREKIMYDLAYAEDVKEQANDKAIRWQKILDNVNSSEENNWKVAVMDADILLDEVLAEQGFVGAGVGEKLKDAEGKDIGTLQYAWEGHKIRNKIAHAPDFELSQQQARTAISMFERFFNEFYHAT